MKRIIIICLLLVLALPGSVFATEAGPQGSYEFFQVEYRYSEGETPDIAPTIERFGRTFNLVGQSDPILESLLPEVRTYRYRINGYLTPEQLKQAEALGIVITPVIVEFEREVDVVDVITMNTNDVDDIPKTKAFKVTSAKDPSGFEMRHLRYTGVTFERIDFQEDALPNGLKLPSEYEATVIYRGIETYSDVGYYYADAVFETEVKEGEEAIYVIIADYQSDMITPGIIDEEEIIPPVDEIGSEEDDDNAAAIVDGQTGNPLTDIINGNVPLGNANITGVWSFLSLILSVAGIVIACIYAIGAFIRRRSLSAMNQTDGDEEELVSEMMHRGFVLRLLIIVVSFITMFTWLMLDDFTHGMVWINSYTIVVGIMFLVTVVLCALTNMRDKRIAENIIDGKNDEAGGSDLSFF